jgi:AcrR family transcriptional regulator
MTLLCNAAVPGQNPIVWNARQAAARARIADAAFGLFGSNGFAETTVGEIAAAAGISRAYFWHLFRTKEDTVLIAQEGMGLEIVARLAARPRGEDAWIALRRAFAAAVECNLVDVHKALAREVLVRQTKSIHARQLAQQASWRPAIARELSGRLAVSPEGLCVGVMVGAALSSLEVAAARWSETNGAFELVELVERVFDVLESLRVSRDGELNPLTEVLLHPLGAKGSSTQ